MTPGLRNTSSVLRCIALSSILILIVAIPSIGQSSKGSVPDSAAHNGSISISHPGHVQIFTVPNNNAGFVNRGYPKCCINGFLPNNPAQAPSGRSPIFFDGRRHRRNFANGGFGGAVYAVPYYYPPDFMNPVDDTMEQTYAPGPTIFDRASSTRSSLDYERSYDERLRRIERQMEDSDDKGAAPNAALAAESQPAADQQPTVLVFRNGHTEEVKNYAIVGDTLFDFTSDHRRRISLYDLDLPATQKKNDDRGVDFRLPVGYASN
jgi:hypothetical protein